MRISALEEYGLRCLVTLAKEGTDGMLSIADMAQKEGLSVPYTSKLLSILRKNGLVVAERGRGGGFMIARDPQEIDLFEVITALGGPIIDPDHCTRFSGQREECVHADNCSVHEVLGGLAGYIQEFLSRTTLADLISTGPVIELKPLSSRVNIQSAPRPSAEMSGGGMSADAE
ncbi:Rrf2 family transcriptional regulator [candidate division GN15 bacterium]|nr:Rrf2 family transcriptional regulator [candidate division GN15 bacterium]